MRRSRFPGRLKMKRFFRCLLWFFVGFFLAVCAGFAFADAPVMKYYAGVVNNVAVGDSEDAACRAYWGMWGPSGVTFDHAGHMSDSYPNVNCWGKDSKGNYVSSGSWSNPAPVCAIAGGAPFFNSGWYYPDAIGQCGSLPKTDCSTKKGQTYTGFSSDISKFPNIGCIDKCEVISTSIKPGFGGSDGGSGGVGLWVEGYVGSYTFSGNAGNCQTATPSSTPPNALGQQGNCPPGQVYQGTINGKPYCGPPTSNNPYQEKTGTTTTTTNSDGSSSTKTDSQTTKCDGTNCTTTDSSSTSNTGADGGTTITLNPGTSTTTSQDSFCSQHPTAAACGGGGGSDTPDICKDNPNILACQQAANGASVDDIYQKKGKTFSDVLDNFKNSVMSSQLGTAFTGYLNVSAMSGSCPDMTLNMPGFGVSSTFLNDIFCGSMFYNILQGCGTVILALASFVAFKWAVL